MNICAITCTGDRPEAFALCEKYMARQTLQPDMWVRIMGPDDYGTNLKTAIAKVPADTDVVVVIEDDDFYAPNHIESMLSGFEDPSVQIVGSPNSHYYNVKYRLYQEMGNTKHASLCETAFRVGLLPNLIEIIQAGRGMFDMYLWKAARHGGFVGGEKTCIGIKNLPGRSGIGVGHRPHGRVGWQSDPDLEVLKEWVGDDWVNYEEFYCGTE